MAALGAGSFGRARSLGERCGGLTAARLERALPTWAPRGGVDAAVFRLSTHRCTRRQVQLTGWRSPTATRKSLRREVASAGEPAGPSPARTASRLVFLVFRGRPAEGDTEPHAQRGPPGPRMETVGRGRGECAPEGPRVLTGAGRCGHRHRRHRWARRSTDLCGGGARVPLRQVFTRWDARGVPTAIGGEEIAPRVSLFPPLRTSSRWL